MSRFRSPIGQYCRVPSTYGTPRGLRRNPRRIGQCRLAVLSCALLTTIVKLRLAATTRGSNDVVHWETFARLVHKLGPVDIYGTHMQTPYNHPPLTTWYLVVANWIHAHGVSVRFLIRVPASVADLFTALLIFELVRASHDLPKATVAGVTVALTPVLVTVSGFHGNTDPVFVMFIVLSAYLVITDRNVLAGMSAAAAISIKLVPVVALPVLAAALWRDRRRLLRAASGFLIVFVPLWAPSVLRQWTGLKRNVLDYNGLLPKQSQWGVVEFARTMNQHGLVNLLVGPGRFAVVALAGLLPAYYVLRSRESVAVGVGLSLALMLLLTTTFGMQYVAWAAAAVLLLDVWWGVAYNVVAGVFVLVVYTHWNHGWPWNIAAATRLTPWQVRLGGVAWLILLVCVLRGIKALHDAAKRSRVADDVADLDSIPTARTAVAQDHLLGAWSVPRRAVIHSRRVRLAQR
jgi:hypothetical protein